MVIPSGFSSDVSAGSLRNKLARDHKKLSMQELVQVHRTKLSSRLVNAKEDIVVIETGVNSSIQLCARSAFPSADIAHAPACRRRDRTAGGTARRTLDGGGHGRPDPAHSEAFESVGHCSVEQSKRALSSLLSGVAPFWDNPLSTLTAQANEEVPGVKSAIYLRACYALRRTDLACADTTDVPATWCPVLT
eukprot:3892241-Rhodomonas_salina.2